MSEMKEGKIVQIKADKKLDLTPSRRFTSDLQNRLLPILKGYKDFVALFFWPAICRTIGVP